MAPAVPLGRARAVERLGDGAPHDELAGEDAHRRDHRLTHHRLARARDKAAQRGAQIVQFGRRMQQPSGQHQRPGRGVDEQRVGMAEMARPIGLAELVADQPVDGLGVGYAQQRLGEAQQRHPLLRGQRVFVQQRIDAALAETFAANRGDEAAGGLSDMVARLRRNFGECENARHGSGLVDAGAVADRGAQRRGRRQGLGEDHIHGRRSLIHRAVLPGRTKLSSPGGADPAPHVVRGTLVEQIWCSNSIR